MNFFSHSPSDRLSVINLRKKFSPGLGFESGSPALRAGILYSNYFTDGPAYY